MENREAKKYRIRRQEKQTGKKVRLEGEKKEKRGSYGEEISQGKMERDDGENVLERFRKHFFKKFVENKKTDQKTENDAFFELKNRF